MQLGLTLEALPRLQALKPALGDDPPPRLAADFWRRLALLGSYGGLDLAAQQEAAEAAVHWARRAGSRRRLHAALSQHGHVLLQAERSAEVAPVLAEMAALERPDDPPFIPSARAGLHAAWLSEQHRHEEALEALREQQRLLARAPGEHMALLISQANLAWTLSVTGRHDEVVALTGALLSDPRLPPGLNVVGFERIHALARLGRVDEALAAARQLQRHWHLSPLPLHGGTALACLAAARGRLDDALRIEGACTAYRRERGLSPDALTLQAQAWLDEACASAGIDEASRGRWLAEGETLGADEWAALALRDGG